MILHMYESILKKASRLTDPSPESKAKMDSVAKSVMDLVVKHSASIENIKGASFGGSYAKDTWIGNDSDVDIFVRFAADTDNETFRNISLDIGFKALAGHEPYARHSEHPFVEAIVNDVKVNIVPFYDVTDGNWKSAADRSVFHADLMSKSLTPKMKRDVRLLKAFLKAGGLYGSEIAKQGFSGYVTEVLVLELGSFVDVLKTFADLTAGQTIGKATGNFSGPIIIIDPVDGNRNLAAAISPQNLGGMVLASRKFLDDPLIDALVGQQSRTTNHSLIDNVLLITFKFTDRSPDIIAGQKNRDDREIHIGKQRIQGCKMRRVSRF